MQADLEELKSLHETAKRSYCKDLLLKDIQRLEGELNRQTKMEEKTEKTEKQDTPRSTAPSRSRTKIDLYGWGQSDRFLNLYVSDKLKDLKGLPAENVTSSFTERSVQLEIKDLNGRDYYFTITNLGEEIIPEESNHKIKSDSIVLNLRKKTKKEWNCVTAVEKAIKERKKNEDESEEKKNLASGDPQASLMGLMKKMYAEGDDDMKRTIAKAMYEGQQKKDANPAMMGM